MNKGEVITFDPEKVKRHYIAGLKWPDPTYVEASDYDQLLALYNSERVPPPSFASYATVRKNIEAGMAIGAEHARGVVAQVQAKVDEASKKLLDEFEERYAQINGKKNPTDDEIKGNPI